MPHDIYSTLALTLTFSSKKREIVETKLCLQIVDAEKGVKRCSVNDDLFCHNANIVHETKESMIMIAKKRDEGQTVVY